MSPVVGLIFYIVLIFTAGFFFGQFVNRRLTFYYSTKTGKFLKAVWKKKHLIDTIDFIEENDND